MSVVQNMARDRTNELLKPPVGRAAYSDRTAWLMAEMSVLAYEKFESNDERLDAIVSKLKDASDSKEIKRLLTDYLEAASQHEGVGRLALVEGLRRLGFELVQTFNSAGSQAFIAKRDVDRIAVLAFRGTEANDWRDVKSDLNAFLKDDAGCKVHTGFKTAFEMVRLAVERTLNGLKGYQLYVTGHSLGGAMALIATRHLNSDNLAACYTFGSPKVGTQEFGDTIKPPIYRVVNSADGVSRVPPTWTVELIYPFTGLIPIVFLRDPVKKFLDRVRGYRHHGDMRYLTSCSQPDFSDIKLYQNLNFIDRATRLVGRLSTNWKAAGEDHRIAEYSGKLKAYAISRLDEKAFDDTAVDKFGEAEQQSA